MIILSRSGNLANPYSGKMTRSAEFFDLFFLIEVNRTPSDPISNLPQRRAEPMLARKGNSGRNFSDPTQLAQKSQRIGNVIQDSHNHDMVTSWWQNLGKGSFQDGAPSLVAGV